MVSTSFSTGELENYVVKQLKDELDLLKDEIESLKLLTKEMNSIRLEYKKDIETLTQQLDKERTKISSLQLEMEHLRSIKGD